MIIAIYRPRFLCHSVGSYIANVSFELAKLGIEIIYFSREDPLPKNVDLYWDPRTGRNGPHPRLRNVAQPYVATFHGAAYLALSLNEFLGNSSRVARKGFKKYIYEVCETPFHSIVTGYRMRLRTLYEWHKFSRKCAAIITVSDYAKKEFETFIRIRDAAIYTIYHGLDHTIFKPAGPEVKDNPYFLHISTYQPLKNLARIIAAYERLHLTVKPRLKLVVPGYHKYHNIKKLKGVELIQQPMTHKELAPLYQSSIGFIFPSLRESFGMPLLEAMGSGCPVITSNNTACQEIVKGYAVLVNPRSVTQIAHAMQVLSTDNNLRANLRKKGLIRAGQFNWAKTAEKHLEVFLTAMKWHQSRHNH